MQLMTREQYEKWVKAIPANECPFCLTKKYEQTVLKETANWYWIVNIAPYWKYHTMMIPKKHYTDINEIPQTELIEMTDLYKYARDKLISAPLRYSDGERVYQYVYFWRVRNPSKASSDIRKPSHFHLHLAPDRNNLFDPIMDEQATQVGTDELLSLLG